MVRALGHFVIADFDGDHKPDFATVNIDQSFIHETNYSIHFELSQGLELQIGLTAPSGGLQLITRDVNGDDILDLVVRTAFDSNLVAVLLNDGHGRFTLAKPEVFRTVTNEPSQHLRPEVLHQAERAVVLPSRNSFGDRVQPLSSERIGLSAERIPCEEGFLSRGPQAHSEYGRAPPERS